MIEPHRAQLMLQGNLQSISPRLYPDIMYVFRTTYGCHNGGASLTDDETSVLKLSMATSREMKEKHAFVMERESLEYEVAKYEHLLSQGIARLERDINVGGDLIRGCMERLWENRSNGTRFSKSELKKYAPLLKRHKQPFDKVFASSFVSLRKVQEQIDSLENQESQAGEHLRQAIAAGLRFMHDSNMTDEAVLEAVCSINECNPILLVEAIRRNLFDSCSSFADVAALLSSFLESPVKNATYDTDAMTDEQAELDLLSVALVQQMNKSRVPEDMQTLRWELYCSMTDVVYKWITLQDKGNPNGLFEVIRPEGVYEGEFVRYMLKLNNLCKEAYNASVLLESAALANLLADHQQNIIRGFVTPQSMFVY